LTQPVYWIGRDPRDCAVARPDDVLVSPKHARLHRDVKGQWHVSNNKSVNGLWLRIEQIVLEGACQIRLGEQRFQFRVS
jgi:pSer/pThr/pTyr-binding forkhead associated (FHA) protein